MTRDREIPIHKHIEDVGPVARVWVVAQSMPRASRKDVLAACVALGIKEKTAATQYQLWQYSRRQAKIAKALPDRVRRQIQKAAQPHPGM